MTEPVYMMVDAYLKADTTVRRGLELHGQNQWVAWVRVGAFPNQFGLYFATLDDIDRFAKVLADARHAWPRPRAGSRTANPAATPTSTAPRCGTNTTTTAASTTPRSRRPCSRRCWMDGRPADGAVDHR